MKPYENPSLLRELFTYDADTGRLTHAEGKRRDRAGELADTFIAPDGSRRVSVRVNGRRNAVSAHRAAWAIAHGEIPSGAQVLHINGDKADNRLVNLKLVTAEEREDAKVRKPSRKGKRRAAPAPVVEAPADESDSVEDDDPVPELPPPVKPLAEDDPRRQRYAELLAEASRVSLPRLRPGNGDELMSQIGTVLGVTVPEHPTAHAAVWHGILTEQGLGELLEGNSKQVLTIFFLLCWKAEHERCAEMRREENAAALMVQTLKRFREAHSREAHSTNNGDKNHDNDSPAMAVHRAAAEDGATA
ncbi:HNH endonuclease signature motif containing protein [Phytobacter palmae]|uniref:HNH endonuclease signature motif containing protein n=1 Tax=Phytobacter palmae TaxID=1855371 RepID=A0ABU9V337_9ENTR